MFASPRAPVALVTLLAACAGDANEVAGFRQTDADAFAAIRGDQAGELSGWAVAGGEDVSGDGVADVIIGAAYADEHHRLEHGGGDDIPPGAAFVFHGPLTGARSLGQADAFLVGVEAYDTTARSVASPGDMDGDGIGEVVVGAMHVDRTGEDAGAVYVLRGPVVGSTSLDQASVVLYGPSQAAHAGAAVAAAGDLDGDGLRDVIVAAHLAGRTYSGEVYVLRGPLDVDLTSGTPRVDEAAQGVLRATAKNALGRALDGAGDVDGDGLDDVIVAAPLDEPAGPFSGTAWVVPGPVDVDATVDEVAVAELTGDPDASCGSWVAAAGDTNADGYDDVLVGAYKDPAAGVDAGAAFVLTGPVTAWAPLSQVGARLTGVSENDKLGFTVDGVGDLDGDGADDLVLGAPLSGLGASLGGAAFVVHGPVDGVASVGDVASSVLLGTEEGAMMGSVAGVGDLDGDGAPDIAAGAPYAGGLAGAVYLFSGGSL